MPELTALLLQIKEAGFLINNLHQHIHPETGRVLWRASLYLEKNFEFGTGETPEEALRLAIRKVTAPSATWTGSVAPLSKKLTLEDLGL